MNYIIQAVKSVPILLAVIALHAVLLWQVVQSAPAETPKKPPKPIMVNLITPPPVEPPAPVSLPPVAKKPPKTISKPVKPTQQPLKQAERKPAAKRKKVKQAKRTRQRKSTKRVKRKKPVKVAKPANRSKKSKKAVRPKKVTSTKKTFPEPEKATTFRAQPAPIAKNLAITSSPTTPSAAQSQGQHLSELPTRRSRQVKPASRKVGGITTPPLFRAAYLHNPHPAYPRLSKRRGEQGTVLLRVKVNQNGRAALVQINQSSGFKRLDNAASQAVKGWRFVPAKKAGQSVTDWVVIPIVFKLR